MPAQQLPRRLVVAQRRLDVERAAVQRQQLAVDDELVALGVAAEVVVVVEHEHAARRGRRWPRSSRPRPARSTRRRRRRGRRSRRCGSLRPGRARGRRAAGATASNEPAWLPRMPVRRGRIVRPSAAPARRACASSASAQLQRGSSDRAERRRHAVHEVARRVIGLDHAQGDDPVGGHAGSRSLPRAPSGEPAADEKSPARRGAPRRTPGW